MQKIKISVIGSRIVVMWGLYFTVYMILRYVVLWSPTLQAALPALYVSIVVGLGCKAPTLDDINPSSQII